MTRIRYLLDEHVDPRLRKGLKRRYADMSVWCVGDPGAPAYSAPDPEILSWCERSGFLLVTNNRASMPVHLQDHVAIGKAMPGIFILNPRMSMGATVDELALIWEVATAEEYVNQMRYLPLSI